MAKIEHGLVTVSLRCRYGVSTNSIKFALHFVYIRVAGNGLVTVSLRFRNSSDSASFRC